ncbi:MAG TPA: hypothetical protein VFD70_10120 [Anaerolineae bacterium]|nr:hypothetical protein [Anaerolineae bacterium]
MADTQKTIEIWDLWYPHGGATGVPFARGRLDATNILIVHAPPESLTVEVRTDDGQRLAYGKDLPRTADRPMARLMRRGETIERQDTWLHESDIGRPVILPGGEVGIILSWWNADDGSEWRWQVEFYNHR